MHKVSHILLLTIFVCSASLGSMENLTQINFVQYAPSLPQEIIAHIASYSLPKEKNRLMRVCRDFCTCLKNRQLIVCANPYMVRLSDKEKDMFTYTYANNVAMMRFLLNNGIEADIKNILGITLLHIACDNNNEEAKQLLIDYGADIDEPKPSISALHEATYNGDEEMVKKLLKLKINPNVFLDNRKTPLHIACHQGHANIVELLLHAGAHINEVDNEGWTPLHIASKNYPDIVKLLINAGAGINLVTNKGITPLGIASNYDQIAAVTILLNADGIEVNRAVNSTMTPLNIASRRGHIEIVKLLLTVKNININLWNPLFTALSYAQIDVIRLLIKAGGIDIKQMDNEGIPPLHRAVQYGYSEIVKLLLTANDVDVNKAIYGSTPLHLASSLGDIKIVKLLLAAEGIEVNKVTGSFLETPLCSASASGHIDIVRLLINAQANIDFANFKGWTPLCAASHRGHTEIVQLLLAHNANVHTNLTADSTVDPLIKAGDTALDIARKKGHTQIVELLQEYLKEEEEEDNRQLRHVILFMTY